MSYLQYPRLHFSGKFKASPSTINNAPNNYDPKVYPSPNDLENTELYWNPKGDGGFDLVDCVVTRVDYDETHSATDPTADSIIGMPVTAVRGSFPLPAAMVDLDPYQQNVSEIWAMNMQIGSEECNVVGAFVPVSFYAIWLQCQGPKFPHSSASGSGVYQSKLTGVRTTGSLAGSKFVQMLKANGSTDLSVNFNVYAHNNKPPILSFNTTTFAAMAAAPTPVPASVLKTLEPMQSWVQNKGKPKGDIPVQDFVVFMLQQLLSLEDYNANVDTIISCSASPNLPYSGSTPQDFLHGLVTGTVGETTSSTPNYFVPSRVICPSTPASGMNPLYFAPFVMGEGGTSITLNLGNSLATTPPQFTPYEDRLGDLHLVAFPGGMITVANATKLANIPYNDPAFIAGQAGFFKASGFAADYSRTPLGILSERTIQTAAGSGIAPQTVVEILGSENPQGYYMRADQFVLRMNPGETTGPQNPRGSTARANIHVLQWGAPVAAGVSVKMSQMLPDAAETYTTKTLGTGGTLGIHGVSKPQDVVSINGSKLPAGSSKKLLVTAVTDANGVAGFDLVCTNPGNPRVYLDGQVYFLEYGFDDASIQATFNQDANDKISLLVYDEIADMQAADILAKWGRLYKIMYFLADQEKITEISFRNIIKQMLEKPFSDVKHMPLTRDLGEAARTKVVEWINSLNNSTTPHS